MRRCPLPDGPSFSAATGSYARFSHAAITDDHAVLIYLHPATIVVCIMCWSPGRPWPLVELIDRQCPVFPTARDASTTMMLAMSTCLETVLLDRVKKRIVCQEYWAANSAEWVGWSDFHLRLAVLVTRTSLLRASSSTLVEERARGEKRNLCREYINVHHPVRNFKLIRRGPAHVGEGLKILN
ncbi:hypothetical protein PVAP13_5KG617907 [Panicum virgatum]|uniref:Uncharacterized protein n=1 Tax=Panicum virgatum TaxID=38727 RepID=A0A8T0SXJ2_PANVG|nr:hypothetical protein PVAP13_5KG617907 [Panicum virgatum]